MAYCRTNHLLFLALIVLYVRSADSQDQKSCRETMGSAADNGACGPEPTTTAKPSDKQGKLIIEEMPEDDDDDNYVYYRKFFAEFITVDNCTIDKCSIDEEKMKEAFWQLYLTDKSRHAAAMAMLEPAMFINMGIMKLNNNENVRNN